MDDSKVVWCMNGLCGSSISSTSDSKKGWPLRSGQFATLCINCGSAYEQLIFCDMFHLKDSGWRECTSCGKRLHCGCIASSSSLQLLDTGGVNCTHCAKKPEPVPNSNCEKLKGSANSGGSVGTSEKVNESLCIPNIKMEIYKGKDVNEASQIVTNLSMALASQTMVIEESSLFQRCRHLLPKPPKYCLENSDTVSPVRVARPPVEGRIKNQLLPRYWPRITDQELQQISGESNAIIVPLFEKVLSASDAGRIGRLVLPKACAEAYFPAISQPEGLPLRIQDVKGKEWIFQFRFWPNNNSRMYVLEGVTPCIHSMQLLAGDTVTFSRMDPGGKLLMGFRKASIQDTNLSSQSKTGYTSEPFFSDFSSMSGYSGFLQSLKAGDIPLPPSIVTPERKRSRNIGSKSKRLVIDNEDALELKLSWEELQDMLRPPLTCEPSTIVIEDHEFEEYQEPPVLAKRSIFTVGISGVQEQWAQCDSCLKWRKLPADFLIPSKWTCVDNIWDDIRTSCAAPDELSPRELENLLIMNNEFKKQKCGTQESVEVDGDSGGASVAATTTKHPRHRPGCSCIVCIQPPSGKGKHKPTCTCNVCMTVKRRFKTLMMRKKKRQSDREAEIAQRNQLWAPPEESSELDNNKISISSGGRIQLQLASAAELDLNSNPNIIHDDLLTTRGTMMTLLQEANMPLQIYLKQNGLTSLVNEQQGSSGSQTHDQPNEELSHSGNNSS